MYDGDTYLERCANHFMPKDFDENNMSNVKFKRYQCSDGPDRSFIIDDESPFGLIIAGIDNPKVRSHV